MQFDVVIGNPYQLDDGGFGTSTAPIYQKFVEQAKKLNPRLLTMVIPSRWFRWKGLDDFRVVLTDTRIRSIDDYLSASDVFPGIGLKGGVAISCGTETIRDRVKSQLDSRTTSPPSLRARFSKRALTYLFDLTGAVDPQEGRRR